MYNLQKDDFKILKYIFANKKVTQKDICNKFSDIGLERFHKMIHSKDIEQDVIRITLSDGSLSVEDTGYYVLSKNGKINLKNYIQEQRKDNFRFWVPIIISVFALVLSFFGLFLPKPELLTEQTNIATQQNSIMKSSNISP